MTQIAISIFVGITSGLIASYIFLNFYIKSHVPVINISDNIANIPFRGREVYMFKFVNRTDVPIFDVRVELTLMQSVGAPHGRNFINKDIELKDGFFAYIKEESKGDKHSVHAYRVHTSENIHELWEKNGIEGNNTSYLMLTIMAKHSLTGLSKVFSQNFDHISCIKPIDFEQGNNLNLIS